MKRETAYTRTGRINTLVAFLRYPNCYWCDMPMSPSERGAPDFCTVEHLVHRGKLRNRYRVLAHKWCNETRETMTFNEWIDLVVAARTAKVFPWKLQVKEETG